MIGDTVRSVRYSITVLGISALAFAALPASANLVVNGSFELNSISPGGYTSLSSISGWTSKWHGSGPAPAAYTTLGNATPAGVAEDANNYLVLRGQGNYQISQMVTGLNGTFKAPQEYKLTFWYAAAPGNTAGNDRMKVTLGSTNYFVTDSGVGRTQTTQSDYHEATITFTAVGNSINLAFTGVGNTNGLVGIHHPGGKIDQGMFIDNISIAAVPEFGSLMGLGGLVAAGGFAGFRRRKRVSLK